MEGSKSDARLLHSLNKFIALISHVDGSEQTKAGAKEKMVANFLRLNLLTNLRQAQQGRCVLKCPDSKERDLMVQWWITLLNFLSSDGNLSSGHGNAPGLSIEVVSVSLECISRIQALLIIEPSKTVQYDRNLEVYSYHTLLTVHYVTNRLITNTKRRKAVLSNSHLHPQQVSAQLDYQREYNTLLNSFMGKIIAYAFFFLDPSFSYDYLVLSFLEPAITPVPRSFTAFPWKKEDYNISYRLSNDQRSSRTGQDNKIFQVMISYLKNDAIFMAFYWHYWYISLRLLASQGLQTLEPTSVPGFSVLSKHILRFIADDFESFTKFVKTQESDTPLLGKLTEGLSPPPTNEQINNFVFVKLRITKLWECLRTLVGCFDQVIPKLLSDLIALHDNIQLKRVSKIPAHEHHLGNLAYNRILQFILFQFESLPQYVSVLNWNRWCGGLIRMIKTLNVNCQSIALLALFNMWDFIATKDGLKERLVKFLVVEMWNQLALDTNFDIVKILFFKVVVFRLMNDEDDTVGQAKFSILRNLQEAYRKASQLAKNRTCEGVLERSDDSLVFHMNKKLILSKVPVIDEETLIRDGENSLGPERKTHILIPSVISAASVRPLVVASRGRYPFDVLDIMVLKAAKKAATKRKELAKTKMSAPSRPVSKSRSTSISSRSTGGSLQDEEEQANPISSALGSFLSKFGTSGSKSSGKVKSLTDKVPRNAGNINRRRSSGQGSSLEVKNDSESMEVLSMYSSLSATSSLSANRSGSSLELRTHPSNPSLSIAAHRKSAGASKENQLDSVQQTQTKRKLLAPPEQKYSGTINGCDKFQWTFRLVTAPMSGSSSSVVSRVQEANDRWGFITARSYDKPLPPTLDYINNTSNILSGDIDISLLNRSMNDIELSDNEVSVVFDGPPPKSENRYDGQVPFPDFLSLGTRALDGIEPDNFRKCGESSSLSTEAEEDKNSFIIGGDHISGFGLTRIITMRQETELKKLINAIDVFNATAQELSHFSDMLHVGEAKIIMDLELVPFKGAQLGNRTTVSAQVRYL